MGGKTDNVRGLNYANENKITYNWHFMHTYTHTCMYIDTKK